MPIEKPDSGSVSAGSPPQGADQKNQMKRLENEFKQALKKKDLDGAQSLAEQIKAIDPAAKAGQEALDKALKMREKLKQEQEANRLKEYQDVFKSLYENGEIEKIYQLAQEYQTLDPKGAEKWVKKANKFEVSMGKEEHGAEIKDLKEKVKIAFYEKQFDEALKYLEKLQVFEPGGSFGKAYTRKIERAKAGPSQLPSGGKAQEIIHWAKDFMEEMKQRLKGKKEEITAALSKSKVSTPSVTSASAPFSTSSTSSPSQVGGSAPSGDNIFSGVMGTADKASEEQGNIFTRMFVSPDGSGGTGTSIIDVIVDRASQDEKGGKKIASKEKKKEKRREGIGFLRFAKGFFNFTLVFVVFSATFLYVNIMDQNNVVLRMFNIEENYASTLHKAGEKKKETEREKETLEEDIGLYKGGYNDQYSKTIETIIGNRLNWPDVLAKVNEVANSIYELNDFFQYISFNNFSFNSDSKKLTLNGTLRDPAKKNLARMVELEEAFKYYPGDKDVESDTIKPYFINNKEFTSYSKSYDKNTDDYVSRFSLDLRLNE